MRFERVIVNCYINHFKGISTFTDYNVLIWILQQMQILPPRQSIHWPATVRSGSCLQLPASSENFSRVTRPTKLGKFFHPPPQSMTQIHIARPLAPRWVNSLSHFILRTLSAHQAMAGINLKPCGLVFLLLPSPASFSPLQYSPAKHIFNRSPVSNPSLRLTLENHLRIYLWSE